MIATNTFKRRLGLFLALLGLLLSHSLLSYSTYKLGIDKGIDNYHELCYNAGGFVINSIGQVVQCRPLTTLPKAELDKFFKDV